MIEVTNLTKKYGKHIAVEHLSFRVEKGQIYGFLGPNGAGKSTTMNIMTGYLAATEGTVLINGVEWMARNEKDETLINAGARVVVRRVEGVRLYVEEVIK